MKRAGFLALVLALLAFALACYVFHEHDAWFGFRDGFASELDGAGHEIATWFSWFSTGMGCFFLGLAWRSRAANVGRELLYAFGLMALIAAGTIAVDLHFRSYAMEWGGG